MKSAIRTNFPALFASTLLAICATTTTAAAQEPPAIDNPETVVDCLIEECDVVVVEEPAAPQPNAPNGAINHWSHFRFLPGVLLQHSLLLDGVTTFAGGARGVMLFGDTEDGFRLEVGAYLGDAEVHRFNNPNSMFSFDGDLLAGLRFGSFLIGGGYLFEVASDVDTSTTQGHFLIGDIGWYFGDHFRLDVRVLPYGYRIISETHHSDGALSVKQFDDDGFGGASLLAHWEF